MAQESQVATATYAGGDPQVFHQSRLRATRRWLTRFVRTQPLGAAGAVLLIAMLLLALFAELIAPYDPIIPTPTPLASPSSDHWFGTDQIGRDMFSRIVFGARPSLYTGFSVVVLSMLGGLVLGVVSGYAGGWFDLLAQRVVDGVMAFPGLVLAIGVVTAMGNRIWHDVPLSVVAALAIVMTPSAARVVRGTTLSVKEHQYVEAARVIGCSRTRIIFQHIVPNIMAPVIVIASVQLGAVILAESSLSFLGLGTPPPTPSWGGMLSGQGTRYLEIAPWLAIFPGIALSLAVLAFNLFGDSLRDVLDPRLRQR